MADVFHRVKKLAARTVLAGTALMAAASVSAAQTPLSAVPDFMSAGDGWNMVNSNALDYIPLPSGAKPVTNDPKYPHVGNLQPGQKTDRVADLTNPILKDWAKEQ